MKTAAPKPSSPWIEASFAIAAGGRGVLVCWLRNKELLSARSKESSNSTAAKAHPSNADSEIRLPFPTAPLSFDLLIAGQQLRIQGHPLENAELFALSKLLPAEISPGRIAQQEPSNSAPPEPSKPTQPSPSLRAWSEIYRFALALVNQGRVRPSFPVEHGHAAPRWKARLDLHARQLLASLFQHLPPAAFALEGSLDLETDPKTELKTDQEAAQKPGLGTYLETAPKTELKTVQKTDLKTVQKTDPKTHLKADLETEPETDQKAALKAKSDRLLKRRFPVPTAEQRWKATLDFVNQVVDAAMREALASALGEGDGESDVAGKPGDIHSTSPAHPSGTRPSAARPPTTGRSPSSLSTSSPSERWVEAALKAGEGEVPPRSLSFREERALLQWEEAQINASKAMLSLALKLRPPQNDGGSFALDYLFEAKPSRWVDSHSISEKPGPQVPAGELWQQSAGLALLGDEWEEIAAKGRQLLERLGRLLAPVEMSLVQNSPTRAQLKPAEAWELLTSGRKQLEEEGILLSIPAELENLSERFPRSRVRLARKDGLPPDLPVLGTSYRVIWEVCTSNTVLDAPQLRLLGKQAPLARLGKKWLPITLESAERLAQVAERLEGEWTGPQALGAALAGEVRQRGDLADSEVHCEAGLQALLRQLRQDPQELPVPSTLQASLRAYQQRGLSWLAHRTALGLGTILADDMGLGKTIQIIALLLHFQEQDTLHLRKQETSHPPEQDTRQAHNPHQKQDTSAGPSLVVCPASLVGNWERELARFGPTLKVIRHHGDERARSADELRRRAKAHDVVITTYGLLRRDEALLSELLFGSVILDEAQNIKNPDSAQAKAARHLRGLRRVVLSGTPVENRLSELWSLSEFANPGLLGPLARFRREIALPIERERDARAHRRLQTAITPFVLRRMKSDPAIVPELPEKEEFRVVCALTAEQASLYQKAVENSLAAVEELEGIERSGKVLRLLTHLKQICNHPAQYLKEGLDFEGEEGASALNSGSTGSGSESKSAASFEQKSGTLFDLGMDLSSDSTPDRDPDPAPDSEPDPDLEPDPDSAPDPDPDSEPGPDRIPNSAPDSEAKTKIREQSQKSPAKGTERLAGRSGKLERCAEILEEIVESGEKALVFTQYVEMGTRLCRYLSTRLKSQVPLFHGALPLSERDRQVQSFQQENGGPSVMVLSLRAGGVGLNLTQASHVIHYDRWWNPAVENQATDRAYRIGQKRRVQVHYLLSMGTLEERIDRLLEEKRALAESVISGGEAWLSQLSTDQLRALISLGSDAAIDSLALDGEP